MSGSKLSYVPQIGGLDELLALVADDHKYKEYLQTMKDLRDVIAGQLGDLDTHRKVEMALKRAETARDESEAVLFDATIRAEAVLEGAYEVAAGLETRKAELDVVSKDLEEVAAICATNLEELASDRTAFENGKREALEAQAVEDRRLVLLDLDLQERQDDLRRKVDAVNLALTA